MTARASVDVEELLRWTYADQLVDVLDAREIDRELGWLRGAGSNAGFMERYGALGCHIDCAGSAADAPARAAPDADATHSAMLTLAKQGGEARERVILVRQYAWVGIRPDWLPGAMTRFERVLNGKGKPRMMWSGSTPIACRVVLIDPPEVIAFARRQYMRWHHGLVAVALIFKRSPAVLVAHVVTGPKAPATPWNSTTV